MKTTKLDFKNVEQLSLFPEMEQKHFEEKEEKEVLLPVFNHIELFERLSQSDFRRGFHLKSKDKVYIKEKGWNAIQCHAIDFVSKRLAPGLIPNDGRQTPMRGHPVFIAQHATACCCRGCFAKWHHIPAGRPLTEKEQLYAVSVLMTWLRQEYDKGVSLNE